MEHVQPIFQLSRRYSCLACYLRCLNFCIIITDNHWNKLESQLGLQQMFQLSILKPCFYHFLGACHLYKQRYEELKYWNMDWNHSQEFLLAKRLFQSLSQKLFHHDRFHRHFLRSIPHRHLYHPHLHHFHLPITHSHLLSAPQFSNMFLFLRTK